MANTNNARVGWTVLFLAILSFQDIQAKMLPDPNGGELWNDASKVILLDVQKFRVAYENEQKYHIYTANEILALKGDKPSKEFKVWAPDEEVLADGYTYSPKLKQINLLFLLDSANGLTYVRAPMNHQVFELKLTQNLRNIGSYSDLVLDLLGSPDDSMRTNGLFLISGSANEQLKTAALKLSSNGKLSGEALKEALSIEIADIKKLPSLTEEDKNHIKVKINDNLSNFVETWNSERWDDWIKLFPPNGPLREKWEKGGKEKIIASLSEKKSFGKIRDFKIQLAQIKSNKAGVRLLMNFEKNPVEMDINFVILEDGTVYMEDIKVPMENNK